MSAPDLPSPDLSITEAAACLEALGNPTRLSICRLLVRAGTGGIPVGRIAADLQMAASTLSHHLKVLARVGLVGQQRQGTTLICRSNFDLIQRLAGFLLAECCAEDQQGQTPAGRA